MTSAAVQDMSISPTQANIYDCVPSIRYSHTVEVSNWVIKVQKRHE